MIPTCSPCGAIVAFVRSCYRSRWRLFPGSSYETEGQYVFAPPGAKHLPFFHHYGSRLWTQDEGWPAQELGEVKGARQIWTSGAITGPYPLDTPTSENAACFLGTPLPMAAPDPHDFVGLYPRDCYEVNRVKAIDEDGWQPAANAAQCLTLDVLAVLYQSAASAQLVLESSATRSFAYRMHDGRMSVLPGTIVAVCADYALVFCAGVQNDLQRSLTHFYAAIGPVDYVTFATSPYFMACSDFVIQEMNLAGVDPAKPIYFGGHSLGAVAVSLAAARMKAYLPGADLRLMTAGMPRPGDARLRVMIGNVESLHFVNLGDPLPALPPIPSEWLTVWPFMPLAQATAWDRWRDSPNRIVLNELGIVVPPNSAELTISQLFEVINIGILGTPFPPNHPHTIGEYRRRICGKGELEMPGDDGLALGWHAEVVFSPRVPVGLALGFVAVVSVVAHVPQAQGLAMGFVAEIIVIPPPVQDSRQALAFGFFGRVGAVITVAAPSSAALAWRSTFGFGVNVSGASSIVCGWNVSVAGIVSIALSWPLAFGWSPDFE